MVTVRGGSAEICSTWVKGMGFCVQNSPSIFLRNLNRSVSRTSDRSTRFYEWQPVLPTKPTNRTVTESACGPAESTTISSTDTTASSGGNSPHDVTDARRSTATKRALHSKRVDGRRSLSFFMCVLSEEKTDGCTRRRCAMQRARATRAGARSHASSRRERWCRTDQR